MSLRKSLILSLGAALLLGGPYASAQTTAAPATAPAATEAVPEGGMPHYIRPETPEQRAERLATPEDPGLNPDPAKVFHRFGNQYTIYKVEKEFAKYLDRPGWVRPLAQANFEAEIYQENDKYIWVWHREREPRPAKDPNTPNYRTYPKETIDYYKELRSEFAPLDVAASGTRVKFEEASAGLPTGGSWRNGGQMADMNEDGNLDLVLPPQRGAADMPSIFLGDGRGGWTRWKLAFPRSFNYGTVVVADFNKDKHLDMAFSVHLTGVAVFLGNGKGEFREVKAGLEAPFPTRRMITTDVNADGWTDIVAISEGPVGRGGSAANGAHNSLRAYVNRKKGESWEGVNIAGAREILGGDYLATGNFNGDKYPDFVGASVFFNGTHTMFVSRPDGGYTSASKGMLIPGRSYYYATAAGKFNRASKTDDAIVSFIRHWPKNLDPNVVPLPPTEKIWGLDRVSNVRGTLERTPIVRFTGARRIDGVAAADFDGDGNLDVAYTDSAARELRLLLGDGGGKFKSAQVEGLKLAPQRTYDLAVGDINEDGRPDLMVMYESAETMAFQPKNGSVHVYLNRGVESVGTDRN